MVIRCILFAILCLTSSSVAVAQNFVVIDPGVRKELAKAWDTHNPNQPERAYCATYSTGEQWDVPVYRVTRIHRARALVSKPGYVLSVCPRGDTEIHTRPPTTCDAHGRCHFGGLDAYECFPSEIDLMSLTLSGLPFDVLQCDKHAFVFYFPLHVGSDSLNRKVTMQP